MKITHLSPSAAHRWFVCPGSVRAELIAPIGESNSYALEGTAAHRLFELCLSTKREAASYIGETIRLPKEKVDWEVSEEMAEHVQDGVDVVHRRCGNGLLWVESEILLKTKPVPIRGTLDAGWYGRYKTDDVTRAPKDKIGKLEYQLHLLDLKYGLIEVNLADNKQLRIYARARMAELARKNAVIDSIHLWIYQPRAESIDGSPFRHIRLEPYELVEFGIELQEKIEEAVKPNARRIPGPHCGYCWAQAVCPQAEQAMLRSVRIKFSEDDKDRIGELKFKLIMVAKWAKAVNELARKMADSGSPPTGWKVVQGNRFRRFPGKKTEQLKKILPKLKTTFRLPEDVLAPRELLSVSRVEKLLPPDKRPALRKFYIEGHQRNRLVPLNDKRDAISAALFFDPEPDDSQV